MARVRAGWRANCRELSTYFQSGGLVDAVLNLGLPAPIDVQVAGTNMEKRYTTAMNLARQIRAFRASPMCCPAGYRLPRAATRCQPYPGQRTRPQSTGNGR